MTMKNTDPEKKENYRAPSVYIVEVNVERGFAATSPNFNDGGPW